MKIKDFIKKVENDEVDIVENTKKVLNEVKKINDEYNYFNTIADQNAILQAKELSKLKDKKNKRLLGVSVSIKDAICAKDIETKAGSKILNDYKPLFDSTVVKKIKQEGGIIIGTTAQDEFGFGGFSVNVGKDFKIPLNPIDKERSCGGSSGGAAGITKKANFTHIALGESTGGSIASPASFCGVFGLCPTYGRVSRYGLIDYGNSLDKIGVMAKTPEEIALMLEVISGYDELESTTSKEKVENYSNYLTKDIKGMKIGIIKECFENINDEVKEKCLNAIEELKKKGAICEEISLPFTLKYGLATYYLISTSEASTNLAKYCGLRYGTHEKLEGNFNEYFTKVRSKYFGDEVKRRIILGTFTRMSGFRDAYYIKAAKIRTLIIEEYKKHFEKYDLLVSPVVPYVSPKFKDIEKMKPIEHYMADVMLVGPNIAGLPHMSMNVGYDKNKMPIGLLAIGDHFKEGILIQLSKEFIETE
jgi:aspartyl-tRNA(Asn)/glutamyl-tRNA(Gln) amidotransferase subunit A